MNSNEPQFKGPKIFGICQAVVLIMSGKRVNNSILPDDSVYFRLDCSSGGSGFDFKIKHITKDGHFSFDLDYFDEKFPRSQWFLVEDDGSKQYEYKTNLGKQQLVTQLS